VARFVAFRNLVPTFSGLAARYATIFFLGCRFAIAGSKGDEIFVHSSQISYLECSLHERILFVFHPLADTAMFCMSTWIKTISFGSFR
jgi:hypothetical protein